MYSPSRGRIAHVKTNVSQYVIRHETKTALSGSQMPFEASSSDRALDARSIGTKRMALAGSARAKKIGTRRNAGDERRGRKCRSSSNTIRQIVTKAKIANTSEPADDEAMLPDTGNFNLPELWWSSAPGDFVWDARTKCRILRPEPSAKYVKPSKWFVVA